MLKSVTFCLVFITLVTTVSAQQGRTYVEKPVPGNIRLLDGYHHQSGRSVDSITGKIWKEHGVTFGYDIALDAGDYSIRPEWNGNVMWRTEQIVNGEKVVCVFTNSKRLLIAFPRHMANFYGDIHNQRDLADMMLMVLTYKPQ